VHTKLKKIITREKNGFVTTYQLFITRNFFQSIDDYVSLKFDKFLKDLICIFFFAREQDDV